MSFESHFNRKKRSHIEEATASVFNVCKPNSNTSSEQWSTQTKLSIVAETYSMTENELSQYCHEKGLFPEQGQGWRSDCMQEFMSAKEREAEAKKQAKAESLLRGRARGRLTSTDERQYLVTLIHDAKQSGCRLEYACHEVQIDSTLVSAG
ncbi:mobile element protein [Vibrio ponticus]|nr:mobile element protein [Vibrio ponticus]